jgi:hypothetical protein
MADGKVSLEIGVTAVDRASGVFHKLGLSADNVRDSYQKLGIGMAAIGGAGVGLAGFAVSASMQMESYRARLQTAMHDTQKAAEMFEWAKKSAAKMPFEMGNIIDATTKLQLYGLSAKEWLPRVGDMAGAMGRDVTEAVDAVNMGLMGSVRSLRSFGISRNALLKAGAHEGKMPGTIAVAAPEDLEAMRTALIKVMETKFSGGMERQMATTAGQITNLKDAIFQMRAAIGDILLPTVKAVITPLRDFADWIKEISSSPLGAWAVKVGTALAGIAAGAGASILLLIKLREGLIATQTVMAWLRGDRALDTGAETTNTAAKDANAVATEAQVAAQTELATATARVTAAQLELALQQQRTGGIALDTDAAQINAERELAAATDLATAAQERLAAAYVATGGVAARAAGAGAGRGAASTWMGPGTAGAAAARGFTLRGLLSTLGGPAIAVGAGMWAGNKVGGAIGQGAVQRKTLKDLEGLGFNEEDAKKMWEQAWKAAGPEPGMWQVFTRDRSFRDRFKKALQDLVKAGGPAKNAAEKEAEQATKASSEEETTAAAATAGGGMSEAQKKAQEKAHKKSVKDEKDALTQLIEKKGITPAEAAATLGIAGASGAARTSAEKKGVTAVEAAAALGMTGSAAMGASRIDAYIHLDPQIAQNEYVMGALAATQSFADNVVIVVDAAFERAAAQRRW